MPMPEASRNMLHDSRRLEILQKLSATSYGCCCRCSAAGVMMSATA